MPYKKEKSAPLYIGREEKGREDIEKNIDKREEYRKESLTYKRRD